MDKTTTISVLNDFSEEPIGRHPEDSPYCGENFREILLAPALSNYDNVIILLDGTEGYGSSFLEEAFGGLVRVSGHKKSELRKKLKLVSDEDSSLIEEIWQYIDAAEER